MQNLKDTTTKKPESKKKKRKRRKSTKKLYWNEVTEEKIVEFANSNSQFERNRIYNEHLKNALEMLVFSIMYRYHLYCKEVCTDEELKNEAIAHVLLNIRKFDSTRGTKAYSYFGTAVKRFLIQKRNKYKNRAASRVSVHDDLTLNTEKGLSYCLEDEQCGLVYELASELKDLQIEDKDTQLVVDGLIYILDHCKSLNIVNRQYLFILLKEYTNLTTPQISTAIESIRPVFERLKLN